MHSLEALWALLCAQHQAQTCSEHRSGVLTSGNLYFMEETDSNKEAGKEMSVYLVTHCKGPNKEMNWYSN